MRRFQRQIKEEPKISDKNDIGFGKNINSQRRLINKDGTYNAKRIGLKWYESFNIYHFLILGSWKKFFLVVAVYYTIANLFFTGLYYFFGVENINGLIFQNAWEQFYEVFFFSAQTLTTVGYGRANPQGFWAGAIASFEALIGLLTFALFTGLMYARFAKPDPDLLFSKNIVVAQYKEGLALMFRVANKLNSNLMEVTVRVSVGFNKIDPISGVSTRSFSNLTLERDNIGFFPFTWTIVLPMDENNPFFGMNEEQLKAANPEFFVLLSGFDDAFYSTIHHRSSYIFEDLVWGANFISAMSTDEKGFSLVDLSKVDSYENRQIEDRIGKGFEWSV